MTTTIYGWPFAIILFACLAAVPVLWICMESHSRKIKRLEETVGFLANELEKLKNDTHG
jgi:hypothetical protein